jgi:hypothetical protein
VNAYAGVASTLVGAVTTFAAASLTWVMSNE